MLPRVSRRVSSNHSCFTCRRTISWRSPHRSASCLRPRSPPVTYRHGELPASIRLVPSAMSERYASDIAGSHSKPHTLRRQRTPNRAQELLESKRLANKAGDLRLVDHARNLLLTISTCQNHSDIGLDVRRLMKNLISG